MSTLNIEIPDELLERLQSLAREHSTSLNTLVKEVLLDFVEDETWENEPTVEEIKQMVEESIRDLEAGKLRSLNEFLDELDEAE